jgi:hypothetical protein
MLQDMRDGQTHNLVAMAHQLRHRLPHQGTSSTRFPTPEDVACALIEK